MRDANIERRDDLHDLCCIVRMLKVMLKVEYDNVKIFTQSFQ